MIHVFAPETHPHENPAACCRQCWTPFGCGRTWCDCHTKPGEDTK